jgi:hypothetical protein
MPLTKPYTRSCSAASVTRSSVEQPDEFETTLAGDIPVRTDVRIRDLEPFTLEALRRALAQGLMPFDLEFVDDRVVILRLGRPRAGEARLMVAVEFYPEDNAVVGKVYDAESHVKCATEPRDAHLAGSVRATVSSLLRELAAKVAGDPSF